MKHIKLYLILIVGFAFLLRLGAVGYGLPQSFFGDELVHVAAAFKMLSEKTFLPNFSFYYLPPLFSYLLAPLFAVYGGLSILAHAFSGIQDFIAFVLLKREYFLMFSRAISALLGTGTVFLLYLLGKEVFNKQIGILASVFLAVDVLHIHESQIGRIWAPTTFFFVLGLYCLWRVYSSKAAKWYVLSGAAIGLGYGMGYVPALLLPLLPLIQYVLGQEKPVLKRFAHRDFLSGLLIAVLLVVVFSLANTYGFWRQFGGLISILGGSVSGAPDITPPENYFWLNLISAFTAFWKNNPFLLISSILGMLILFWRGKFSMRFVFLAGMPLLYVLGFAAVQNNLDARYVLPPLPVLALLSSYFLITFFKGIFQKGNAVFIIWKFTIVVFVGFALIYSLLAVLRYNFWLQKPDTRLQAVQWIAENIPNGARIVLDDPLIYLPVNKAGVALLERYHPEKMDTRTRFLASLEDAQYPKPSYAVYNFNRMGDTLLVSDNFTPEYLIYSFWGRKEKEEKEGRYNSLFRLELLHGFYPRLGQADIPDLLNEPSDLYGSWFDLQYLGPFVEVYEIQGSK